MEEIDEGALKLYPNDPKEAAAIKVLTAKDFPNNVNGVLVRYSATIILDERGSKKIVYYHRRVKTNKFMSFNHSFKAENQKEVQTVIDWFHKVEKINDKYRFYTFELKHDFKIIRTVNKAPFS